MRKEKKLIESILFFIFITLTLPIQMDGPRFESQQRQDVLIAGIPLCYSVYNKLVYSVLTHQYIDNNTQFWLQNKNNRIMLGLESFRARCTQTLMTVPLCPIFCARLQEPCSFSKVPDGPHAQFPYVLRIQKVLATCFGSTKPSSGQYFLHRGTFSVYIHYGIPQCLHKIIPV